MTTRMPFGRYRGERIADLPDDYLGWLVGIELRDPLRRAVMAELGRRAQSERDDSSCALVPACPDGAVAEELVHAGWRSLSRKYHPDVGGTHDGMLAVQAAREWLLKLVERAA